MGQIQSIEDLLNFLRRRMWLILAVAIFGALVSAYVAKTRVDMFEATAAIQVQAPQVGGESTAATTGSAQMMQSIEQRLTTREALLGVVNRHNVFAGLPISDDEKVGLMRGMVTFQAIDSVGGAPGFGQAAQISAILVTARADSADMAARIANDFAQGILDMSSSGQIDQARGTLAFHQEEQARLIRDIRALETKIADYKNAHATALPTSAEVLRADLVSLESDIRALDQQLVALMQEQNQLAARSNLRVTERRRLSELESQIGVLASQKAALNSRREEALARVADQPEVERVLSGMERDLDLAQTMLATVSGNLANAETAVKLAERQQGQRFALLDRAVTPQYPVNSGGKKLFLAGTIASLMAGLGLAFVLDLMRPVVRTSAQLERELGIRPVIAIPELALPDPRKAFRHGLFDGFSRPKGRRNQL